MVKHYSFAGQRVAVKQGSTLRYIHGDHLGSSSIETDTSGNQTASRSYYAYGQVRTSSGTLHTDRTFTGQKSDGTGLHFYNARYYDSALGVFLSPDTIVPDAGVVVDYNRFLYVRGNPLKYTDPSGNEPTGPQFDGGGSCRMPGSCWSTDGWINDDGSPLDDTKLGVLLDALNEIPHLTMYYDSEGNPDWSEFLKQEFVSDVLTPCAITFTGVCGVSWGFSAGAGAGGRTSLELYVDQEGETGLFWTIGGGAYVPFSIGQVETSKITVVGMNNASVDDMKSWSAQLGAAGKVGLGFQAEWIVAKNAKNESMHGLAVGSSAGAGLDIHFTLTHTWRFR